MQRQNNVPKEFPLFVRNGFNIKVVADGYTMAPNGLIYKVRVLQTQYGLNSVCMSLPRCQH